MRLGDGADSCTPRPRRGSDGSISRRDRPQAAQRRPSDVPSSDKGSSAKGVPPETAHLVVQGGPIRGGSESDDSAAPVHGSLRVSNDGSERVNLSRGAAHTGDYSNRTYREAERVGSQTKAVLRSMAVQVVDCGECHL